MTRLPLSPPLTSAALRRIARERGVDVGRVVAKADGNADRRDSVSSHHTPTPPRRRTESPATATTPRQAPEMPRALTFWIPRPPDNANARGHSRALNREKRNYWKALSDRLAADYFMPRVPDAPLPCAMFEATYYHCDRRSMLDTDNAVRRLKPVVDWLVGNGFLAGDTPDQLEWTIPKQVVGKIGTPAACSVQIILTPITLRPAGAGRVTGGHEETYK